MAAASPGAGPGPIPDVDRGLAPARATATPVSGRSGAAFSPTASTDRRGGKVWEGKRNAVRRPCGVVPILRHAGAITAVRIDDNPKIG